MRVITRACAVLLLCILCLTAGAAAQEALTGLTSLPGTRVCGPFPFSVSETGIDFIKRHEGFRPKPYHDARGYAVGYGMHSWLGKKVTKRWPKLVTRAQADKEFARQLTKYQSIVETSVCQPLNQDMYDSLVSVAYNLGRVNTRILDRLQAGMEVRPHDFLSTATVRGRVNRMLKLRRLGEYTLFQGGYGVD